MSNSDQTRDTIDAAVSNGIQLPSFSLPFPDGPDTITANLLLLINQTPNPRHKFIYQHLIKHLHAFIKETNLSTDEWMTAMQFLTRTGQLTTPARQEMVLLSGVLGVSALVEALNNPTGEGATEGSAKGPFFTEDAEDIDHGGSIVSHGEGEQMYVEGRVLTTNGEPIANAVIETWEADHNGLYDVQYVGRTRPDGRGRLHTGEDGKFGYRAIVPVSYPVCNSGPIDDLLISQGRHNMRPSHLHTIVHAPGFHKLTTVFYPDDCEYITSDPIFGVKRSLIVKLEKIGDEAEARKRGFANGGPFKLLKRDIVLLTEEQWSHLRDLGEAERGTANIKV